MTETTKLTALAELTGNEKARLIVQALERGRKSLPVENPDIAAAVTNETATVPRISDAVLFEVLKEFRQELDRKHQKKNGCSKS